MAVELDNPGTVDNLYLERDDPVEPWRPIMTGDVFEGPQIPGCAEHELIMVLSHPCSLRRGVVLLDRVQALPVVSHQSIPLDAWKGHYRVMPLPELRGEGTEPYVARLTEFGMISSDELELEQRLCCLSETGVVLLQQRFFHNQSRVKVGLDALYAQSAPIFTEVELWTQWNEQLAEPRVEKGEDRDAVLREEAEAFDAVMQSAHSSGTDLRKALLTPMHRNEVRRLVLAAVDQRSAN